MKLQTIRVAIGILASLILYVSPATAGPRYVDDLHEITVRLGPGVKYRVIQTIPSGTRLETIDSKNGWTQVRLPDKRNGWVVTRYLTDKIPDSKKYEAMKAKCAPLESENEKLKAANSKLENKNQTLSKNLARARKDLATVKENYNELKTASSDVLKLKSENENLAARLEEKNQKIASLKAETTDTFFFNGLKWFLAGAGVLLLGIIIGASGKRKRSTLL